MANITIRSDVILTFDPAAAASVVVFEIERRYETHHSAQSARQYTQCKLFYDGRKKMAAVTSYSILVYGSEEGYQTNRAQIQLRGSNNDVIAWLRFNDPGMAFESDSNTGGIIRMHLPSSMFQSVLDILRNERPIRVYFAQGRGFFGTSSDEPVGEGES